MSSQQVVDFIHEQLHSVCGLDTSCWVLKYSVFTLSFLPTFVFLNLDDGIFG